MKIRIVVSVGQAENPMPGTGGLCLQDVDTYFVVGKKMKGGSVILACLRSYHFLKSVISCFSRPSDPEGLDQSIASTISEQIMPLSSVIERTTGKHARPALNGARKAPSLHPDGQKGARELNVEGTPGAPAARPPRTAAAQAAGPGPGEESPGPGRRGAAGTESKLSPVGPDRRGEALRALGRPLRGSSPSSRSVLARAMYKERMRFLWMRGLNWERAAWGMFADPRLFLGRKTPIQGRGKCMPIYKQFHSISKVNFCTMLR